MKITDLGSHNGTRVNGERIPAPRTLLSGDVLTLSQVTIVVHARSKAARRGILGPHELRKRAAEEIARALYFGRSLAVVVLRLTPGEFDREAVEEAATVGVRAFDVVGWGAGAELWILLSELGADGAREAAVRLLDSVLPLAPGAADGFAVVPNDGCDLETLVASARAASLAAKGGTTQAATVAAKRVEMGGVSAIVADPAMVRLYALAERLSVSDLPVLIIGETGTGKELLARALHTGSPRAGRPLVALNCAAIPEQLYESELFGHERGAFTGATAARAGRFEQAHGGTLFLDEIGEMPLFAQAKLLRVLETKRVCRVGDTREREVELRVVTATNRNLAADVKQGRFREDLLFRLSGATLWLPPLRDRPRELPLLAHAFLDDACRAAGRRKMALSTRAMRELSDYRFPGNVRELKNIMEFVAATVPDPLVESWHIEERLRGHNGGPPAPPSTRTQLAFQPIEDELRALERSRMSAALSATRGNQTKAAALIQMPLRTFVTKMKQYEISPRRGASDPESDGSVEQR